jgi:hypothetical protein
VIGRAERGPSGRIRSAGVLLVSALVMCGCSGTTPSSGGAAAPTGATPAPGATTAAPGGPGPGTSVASACTLLSAADIKSVTGLGVASQKTVFVSGVSQDGCEWTLDDAGASTVQLAYVATGGRKQFDTYFAPYNSPLPGVGDAGIRTDAGATMAVKGDVLLSVDYVEFPSVHKDYAAKLLQLGLDHVG